MNIKNSSDYLIHLINCALFDKIPCEKPDNISFKEVFELGAFHEVANIAFLAVEKLKVKPYNELYNEWKLSYYFSVQRDLRQKNEYEKQITLLHSNKIRTLEAQGTITKNFYPSSELRMMSDIDFIVDFKNFDKIVSIMKSNGYTISFQQEKELNVFNNDGLEIEFHADFFTEYMYNRKEKYYLAMNSAFNYSKMSDNDEYSYVLDDTYFYLYSVLHILKHYETAGCGIRRIIDLYFLKKELSDRIDFDIINNVINKFDFRENYENLFKLEAFWFENSGDDGSLISVINDVLSAGNHGSSEIHTKNTIIKDKKEGVKHPKLKQIVDFLFPSKEYIYLTYPVCMERGYSTFTCRLYRIFGAIRKLNFTHAISRIKTIIKSS